MESVSDSRHRATGKAGRHLVVVPDDPQPPLWDQAELHRLAYLRQLAIDSGQPAEAVRLIEAASTADEAFDALTAAGLIPTEDESLDGALAWFSPLLEPGCDQLDAEVAGSQFIAGLRHGAAADMDVAVPLLTLIADVEAHQRPEAVVMLRVLAAVGPAEARRAAADAASRMVSAGRADPPWAAGLGAPAAGRCFGYDDIYSEQRSLVITFSYGRRRHALVTLIDYGLGGGIKDCYACDYSERMRTEYRVLGEHPAVRFSDYDGAQARAILEDALSSPPCPADPDHVEDSENFLELLRARVALLPGGAEPAAAGRALPGHRAARPKNIHRLKVTLRGTRPPIWRRVEVPSDISLQRLHSVIQIAFGWQDYHLHAFETPAGRYGSSDPDTDIRSSAHKRLSAVADWPGDRIGYEYDFGDCWEHDIVVEAVEPAVPGVRYPRCTGGKRAGPPEDCGGVGGYYRMLDVLADQQHDEHEALLDWLGIGSPGEFDPAGFDRDGVSGAMRRLARVLIRS